MPIKLYQKLVVQIHGFALELKVELPLELNQEVGLAVQLDGLAVQLDGLTVELKEEKQLGIIHQEKDGLMAVKLEEDGLLTLELLLKMLKEVLGLFPLQI